MEAGHFRIRKPLNIVCIRNLNKIMGTREGYNERTCKLNDKEKNIILSRDFKDRGGSPMPRIIDKKEKHHGTCRLTMRKTRMNSDRTAMNSFVLNYIRNMLNEVCMRLTILSPLFLTGNTDV